MADRPRQTPFDPYEGAGSYIFVSYSHSDSARVFPILAALHGQGYRVWYDEGIPWTSEWPAVIESHLSHCAVCLAFLSENFVESQYCRKEIHCAVAESKPILSLYLESVPLRHGLKFQLSDFQSVQFSHFSGIAAFVNRLEHELVFLSCRDIIERREEEHEDKELLSGSERNVKKRRKPHYTKQSERKERKLSSLTKHSE